MSGVSHINHGRTLRNTLAPHWGRVSAWQFGQVTAVHSTTPPTVDVKLDGAAVTTGIYYLDSYAPSVGDVVVVGRMQGPAQTARFVVGRLATVSPVTAMKKIDEVIIGTTAGYTSQVSTVTFPAQAPNLGSGKHLMLAWEARLTGSVADATCFAQLNQDTGSTNYGYSFVQDLGATLTGNDGTLNGLSIGTVTGASGPAGYPAVGTFWLFDYNTTTWNKSAIAQWMAPTSGSGAGNKVGSFMSNWSKNQQVTRIDLVTGNGLWVTGSTFSLYQA